MFTGAVLLIAGIFPARTFRRGFQPDKVYQKCLKLSAFTKYILNGGIKVYQTAGFLPKTLNEVTVVENLRESTGS